MGDLRAEPVPVPSTGVSETHSARAVVRRVIDTLELSPALVRYALAVFVVSRVGFVAITYLALRFLRHINVPPSAHPFIAAWARWDANFYAFLAADGYQPTLLNRAAFFPLQPLVTRLFMPLVGGDPYVAGIVASNLCYFIALLGIASLARHDADEGSARRAMLYLTVFPTAFFLFAGYAESLFLALAIWCVVAVRRHWWWQAGVLGLLASMTRQIGLFLVLPFVYEYLASIGWRLRALRPAVLWVLAIPSGLLLFMGWLWLSVGDPLAFIHAEGHWNHTAMPPWTTFWLALQALTAPGIDGVFRYRALTDLAAVVLIAVLITIGVGLRRLRLGDALFCAAVWLLVIWYPTLGWPLQSDARYMLAAFPCFVLLAREGRRPWLHAAILVTFTLGLLVMTQYFVRGAVII